MLLAGCLVLLSACTSRPVVSDVFLAVFDDKFSANHDVVSGAALNPEYRYLRVQASGAAPALLVLGYVEPHPNGEVQIWYSSKGEVLKLQKGRIVGTAGLATDWSAVSFTPDLPAWDAVPPDGFAFMRRHDQVPGYRAGVSEQLRLQPWSGVPPLVLPNSLPTSTASRYAWYRESAADTSSSAMPAAWYAVGNYGGKRRVVYSQQCLSPKLCLTMQLWPPEKAAP